MTECKMGLDIAFAEHDFEVKIADLCNACLVEKHLNIVLYGDI